ncbi:MAG: carboxypeptidase M32 [Chlamydiota bacterium]
MYKKLAKEAYNIQILGSIDSLLSWDLETRMPKAAIESRSEQQEFIATLIHKKETSTKYKKLLSSCIDFSSDKILDPHVSKEQIISLRDWKKNYLKAKKLPTSFIKTLTKTTSTAFPIWVNSKKKNDFSLFSPILEKIVELMKKKASLLGAQEHPYDALLDLYEPNMTVKKLEPLLGSLKTFLSSFVRSWKNAPTPFWLTQSFPLEKQKLFSQEILKRLPLDPSRLCIDEAEHPFTSSLHPTDVRITTRFQENYLLGNIFALLHEGGHALYDMNLPQEYFGTPVGEAISHGIHESQSRLWETCIGKSYSFWKYFYPILQQIFPNPFESISLSQFYQDIHQVEPSPIRIEADEVTYTLHIILRFEIEKALIENSCQVKDIPDLWRTKMQDLLGITPLTDKEGCLQDVHWASALFGYFPTYALGNLYAAQFFAAFQDANPTWKSSIEQGDLTLLGSWLRENIHAQGKRYTAEELVEKVTGKPLSTKAYESYLEEKYKHFKN